jgi:hypothetical protein
MVQPTSAILILIGFSAAGFRFYSRQSIIYGSTRPPSFLHLRSYALRVLTSPPMLVVGVTCTLSSRSFFFTRVPSRPSSMFRSLFSTCRVCNSSSSRHQFLHINRPPSLFSSLFMSMSMCAVSPLSPRRQFLLLRSQPRFILPALHLRLL